MIFCLFVLNLLGFVQGRVVGLVCEKGCGIGLFCCGFWSDFKCEFG